MFQLELTWWVWEMSDGAREHVVEVEHKQLCSN